MDYYIIGIFQLIAEIIIFLILMFIGSFIGAKLKESNYRIFNIEEYFPKEEIHNLRQMYILIMMGLLFIDILYVLIFSTGDMIYFVIFDIVLSLYVAITLDKSSLKNKILLILLVPYGSLTYIIFGYTLLGLIDLIHIPVFIYLIKVYYDRFQEYTKSNGLGITVILLFSIIFISFLVTQIVENTNPLNSIVMVSNAFTSNGYAVLGNSIGGKLNSLVLVWGGYLLSGVATATLTAAILKNYFNNKIEETNEKIEHLEELIEKKINEDDD